MTLIHSSDFLQDQGPERGLPSVILKDKRAIFQKLTAGIALLLAGSALAAEGPRKDGLILWLDASDSTTRQVSESNGVVLVKDKSGKGHNATSKLGPWIIPNGLGKSDVFRFEKNQSLTIPGVLKSRDKVTVFIVFRRGEDLSGKQPWQKVISSGDAKEGVFMHTGGTSEALSARVLRATYHGFKGENLYVGKGGPDEHPSLRGDIAEILVYDRDFYVESQMQEVVTYLEKKWNFAEDRENHWTHVGPLPEKPGRVTRGLPLSDQSNNGQWTKHEAMWDEFEGRELDDAKWWDHNPSWYGRAPARYLARDVAVADGELRITMQRDDSLPAKKFYRDEVYENYSSGTIKSKNHTVYGYFEIEAMPMASAASSAWWFTGTSWDDDKKGNYSQEIDVFEIGGKSIGREKTYSMNLHIFQTPEAKQHWNRGGEWEAPFRFIDDFHVFGLEWTPDVIRYYVDGMMVRSVKNDAWHGPMQMIFDSETMNDWLGAPKDEDLPSIFRVKYVRAWKNSATETNWKERYQVKDPTKPTGISRYVREMEGLPK